ncbi:carboxymuconolactone decarboxylase family protein [Clostridium sp. Marseille-QA1073]
MKSEQLKQHRTYYNQKLIDVNSFFKEFGELDDKAYSDGAISKKNKELMDLAISIVTRCNECILYHLEGSIKAKATLEEIIEAIKIGVIGGGSITYPNARFAFEMMDELTRK